MEATGESSGVGYLYETREDAFSIFQSPPDPPPTQSYSVLRTEIASTPPPAPPAPAPDYFSLEPDESPKQEVGKGGRPSPPPPPARGASESVWFRRGCRFKSPMLQLHKEILDFCEFVSPTPEEQASRAAAVERVSEIIKYIWPHCNVEVFGSFKTGLYLPTSDIDVVILDSKVRTPQIGLQALSRALSQRSIAIKIQVIAKARVPIIKFVEKQSGVAFDISFDMHNGPKAADFIKVFSGGIGSYALLAMLIAQLRISCSGSMHKGRKRQGSSGQRSSIDRNLGILLVDFFGLYGCKLNICDVGVSCNKAGTFFLKASKGFLNKDRPYLLSIEDPQAADNDIGKNSYNIFKVRSAFAMAYGTLTGAKAIMDLGPNRSILGTIIRPDPALLERKGGSNGELTFQNLLPVSEQTAALPFEDEGDALYNWRLVDDEPFPRGEVVNETFPPLGKREGSRANNSLDESECFKTPDNSCKENGRRGREKKRRRKEARDGGNSTNSGSSRNTYSGSRT